MSRLRLIQCKKNPFQNRYGVGNWNVYCGGFRFFIRSIIGLDVKAAQNAFADFLQAGNLRADQMTFIQNIITYLTKKGTIEPSMLFEPPFTDMNDQGLLGFFDDGDAHKVISIIE